MALVENKPGVLTRVASLFRRRGFNIESLTVGHTEDPDISRMTIVVDASKTNATMVANNLFKLVNVIDVQDATHEPSVTRDLALIKVKATPQTLFELNQMVDIYKAKVVDLCAESVIIEVTGPESKIESVVGMLKPVRHPRNGAHRPGGDGARLGLLFRPAVGGGERERMTNQRMAN